MDLKKAQAESEERWKEEIRRNGEEQKKREKEQEEKQIQLRKDHEAQIAKISTDQKEELRRVQEHFQLQQSMLQKQAKDTEERNRREAAEMKKRAAEAAKRFAQMQKQSEENLANLKKEQLEREQKMEKMHQAQLKQHRKEISTMEIKTLNAEGRLLKERLDNKQKQQAELVAKYENMEKRYKAQTQKITMEKKRLTDMGFADVQDGYVLVLLGRTGTGKSVLTNRLSGDDSKLGNKGPAKSSRASKSCTTHPEIIPCKKIGGRTLYTVDSGGFADTEDRDEDHTNMLCKFLRGCGGINAFVLTKNCADPRITKETKEALEIYEDCFGADFYKHMIIVGSHADADSTELDAWESDEIDLRAELVKSLKLKRNKELSKNDREGIPTIPIGVENFEEAVEEIQSLLKTKFGNKITDPVLNSPIDKLEKVTQKLRLKCEQVRKEVDQFVNEVTSLASRLELIKKEIISKGGIASF